MHQPPDKDGFQAVRSKNKKTPNKGNQQNSNKGIPFPLPGIQTTFATRTSTSQPKTIKDVLQTEIAYKQKQHNEEVLSLALEDLKLH